MMIGMIRVFAAATCKDNAGKAYPNDDFYPDHTG